MHANASHHATRDYEQIAREILAEAAQTDRLEDEQYGQARGDELPAELSTNQGRRGWLREAKRRLDDQRATEARPIAASRPQRLKESTRRTTASAATAPSGSDLPSTTKKQHSEPEQTDRRRYAAPIPAQDQHNVRLRRAGFRGDR